MNKTSTKKWIRLSVILYLVILAVVAVATFAWFLFEETATLQTDSNMQITAGNRLEIAELDKNDNPKEWGSLVSLQAGANTTYPDITGNGLDFYFPRALDANDMPVMQEDAFLKIENDMEDRDLYYITVKLRFRTTMPMDIYLSDGSFVDGKDDLQNGENTNDSLFAYSSRDAIAGAVRVAFLEYDPNNFTSQYILKNVWIPNDKYQLNYRDVAPGEDTTGKVVENNQIADFIYDGERDPFLGYLIPDVEGKMLETAWSEQDYLSRLVTVGSEHLAQAEDNGVPMVNESVPLLTFTADEIAQNGGLAEKTMIIRVWIEGTDREANKAFVGGNMEYKLNFSGFQKEAYSSEEDDTILCSGSKLLYAKDNTEVASHVLQYSYNGIDWMDYAGQLEQSASSKNYVYVRYQEKRTVQASNVMRVALSS